MIRIDLERNIYLDELFIKRCVKTCVRQFKSIRDIKEDNMIVASLKKINNKIINKFVDKGNGMK